MEKCRLNEVACEFLHVSDGGQLIMTTIYVALVKVTISLLLLGSLVLVGLRSHKNLNCLGVDRKPIQVGFLIGTCMIGKN